MFIQSLLRDIECNDGYKRTASKLVRDTKSQIRLDPIAMPLQSYLGNVWLVSPNDTVLNFYSYRDADFCYDIQDGMRVVFDSEPQHVTDVETVWIAHDDNVRVPSKIYSVSEYHKWLINLQSRGFTAWV